MLERLTAPAQQRLVSAMMAVEALLTDQRRAEDACILRPPRPGDFGWMVARHAILYAREYCWTENFEGLCAQIVADFVNNNDPQCERCWIAERDGEIVGSVLLVRDSPEVARLRLLLVEPSARGLGIGTRLTDECVRFARTCGYRQITLWTHSVLVDARRIYERAGFRLTSSEPRRNWGHDVVSEHWDLVL
jgi:GNAT superfamily N-acetyltransferase